jgi:Zinc carboxypeptidase/Secretion system C-terminal sorting domain/Carboxypeptidase regulatory-like domain
MQKLTILIIVTFFLLVSILSFAQEINSQYFRDNGEVYFRFIIKNKSDVNELTKLISIDNVVGDTVYAYANEKEYIEFIKLNYKIDVLTPPGKLIQPKMSNNIKEISQWDTYPTYDAYVTMMYQFQSDYPDICEIIDAGSTVQGREILFAKISDNVNVREAEPQFMFSSSMHGDETTGFVLMLRLIDSLLTSYGTDARITNLVNNVEIWINPLANPDGTYHGGNGTVYGAIRYNANYVDLNRNFPDPQDGPHPDGNAWQPETIIMMNLADENNFVISANFHGGSEVVNYPWDTQPSLHADDNWFQLISHRFADTAQANSPSGYMSGFNDGITNGYQWYEVNGGRQDFFTYFHHDREVTIEISNTKLLPPGELPAYWNYLRKSFLNYIDEEFYGIVGVVTDTSGNPVKAKVEITSHDFYNSEIYSDSLTGSYYRMIYPGTYNVTYSADGYYDQTINNVTAQNLQTTTANVQLVPEGPTPVQLVNFTAVAQGKNVDLSWSTATEANNKGFEIERLKDSKIERLDSWQSIGFVVGKGTTTKPQSYSFIDKNITSGTNKFRLKQIDFDGSFEYSKVVEVDVKTPLQFSLSQNYPNPFNLTTKIMYSIQKASFVNLQVYDILGRDVIILVNEYQQPGSHTVSFDASKLASGIYFYWLQVDGFVSIKKMLFLK